MDEDLEDEDDEPSGPEFEIDASASTYFGYIPKTIAFQAGALNGTPPFTFTWDFADGTEPAHGPYVVHTFKKDGRFDVFVRAQDANGEKSFVQLAVILLTPEEFAKRKGIDPRTLPSETPRDYQTPTPEAPVATPRSTK
jgi:PKD repeat protein